MNAVPPTPTEVPTSPGPSPSATAGPASDLTSHDAVLDGIHDAMAHRLDEFDVTAPLPTGTTLLEASAGTGKTWTIAALVTRYVAEGVADVDEILVVTFTRAASQELRDRVRGQMVDALHVLRDPALAEDGNELHTVLLDDPSQRDLRAQRLADALTAFDTATIATIHEFCSVVLRSLGVAGDSDREAVLAEDLDDLVQEVADDLYLAGFHQADRPLFSRPVASMIAREAVANPGARLEPRTAVTEAPSSPAARRVRFAEAVRKQVQARKRRLGLLSFDDLLTQVADALAAETSPARTRLRERWKVVLIDEFQDTDPVQWTVFQRAFAGVATLVLIGDPKQAIYAFRGGDVDTYLAAATTATVQQTLAVNHRSDQPLVDALGVMLQNAQLGSERIAVQPVRAAHTGARLHGAGPAVRLRQARHLDIGLRPQDKPRVDAWREHVVTDLARDVRHLLASGAQLSTTEHPEGRPVQAGDIAVLAHNNATLRAAHEALRELGVPAVMSSGGSVFHTPAATEWLTLLEAMEQPHRSDRVRAAALTSFFGVSAAALAADLPVPGTDGADLTDQLADRMRVLATLLATRGVAAVVEYCTAQGLTERVLSTVGGERTLTDLRHVGELLHKVAVTERRGLVGLLGWLRTQIADDADVRGERSRRLDSDDAAVQLVTIHSSKGLQYPVVYLPSLWDRGSRRTVETRLFHDAEGNRCLDVGGESEWVDEARRRSEAEDAGEALRLAYVAMTRAQSQVVLWYAPAPYNAPRSALHRLLGGRAHLDPVVPDQHRVYSDDETTAGLQGWAAQGAFQLEFADHGPTEPLPLRPDDQPLSARAFTRTIDGEWRRTSYTSLSAAATDGHGAPADLGESGVVGEVADEHNPTLDAATEPEAGSVVQDDAVRAALEAVPSPMAELPMGATFGSLVHAVLEHADPAAADQTAHLRELVVEHLVDWPVDLDVDVLVAALEAVVSSPMGPLTGQRTLREVTRTDRLCEMDFELPLSGGDSPYPDADDVRLGDLVPLLEQHLPVGDAVRSYADALRRDPGLSGQSLRGYLTGSIDVVMRLQLDGAPRFLTVDYKTNWLGPYDEPLTAWNYRPAAMDEAMAHSDYPLQALLYTVVLHRYLRWRLPDYDPATHLGGVLYLYLRGMCGPETPTVDGHPCGVFSWRAPVGLVQDLSALLDGRRTTPDGGSR